MSGFGEPSRRFVVPAGVPSAVRSVYGGDWRTFTTTRENCFGRFERFDPDGYFEFRADGGWLLMVHRRHVRRGG
jgi:hypothetical protein